MAWTINDIKNDLVELKSLYNKETNPTLREEMSRYIASLERMVTNFATDRSENVVKRGNFYVCQDYIPRYRSQLPHVRDFLEATDDYVEDKRYTREGKEYNFKDMYELTRDFFKSVGGKIYKAYEEFDKEKDNRVNFFPMPPVNSTVYTIPVLNKFYMNIGTDAEDEEIIETYIHEAGHVITFKQNSKRYESLQLFTEIESLFFEILADEYLREQTNDDYFLDLERNRLNEYYGSGSVMDIFNIAYNMTVDNITEINNPDKVFMDICKNEGLLKTTPVRIDNTMKYVFSYICAVELVQIYKQDPEKALFLLDNIISNDNTISEYERIVRNVNPNEHMKEYAKTLTKKRTTQ